MYQHPRRDRTEKNGKNAQRNERSAKADCGFFQDGKVDWHEFGLDVIALVGNLHYGEHRSGLDIAERTVRNLLDHSELLAVTLPDNRRRDLLSEQGRVKKATDRPR